LRSAVRNAVYDNRDVARKFNEPEAKAIDQCENFAPEKDKRPDAIIIILHIITRT
jgi:hypothetical protein